VKRRDFITLLGGTIMAWPLAARAQRSESVRRIVVMMSNAQDDPEGKARATALRQGLHEFGWTEGRNLRIEWYWSGNNLDRIRASTAEIASLAPDLVVANQARPDL
jgi:putative ABC transport system substrate-binding protein